MKKLTKTFTGLFLLLACSLHAQNKTARVHGIDNTEVKTELMYDGVESLLGNSKNISIQPDKNKYFSVEIKLNKPTYYKIGRNTLYLTPGDNLEVVIDEDASLSQFKGKGAEANTYMKGRLFPKGGSFLEAGRFVFLNLDSTMACVHQKAEQRKEQLEKLNNVSKEFKELELARIKADIVNSILKYPSYIRMKKSDYDIKKAQEAINAYIPEINQLTKEINQARFLDVEIVRDVFKTLVKKPEMIKGITLDNRIQETYKTLEKLHVMSVDPTQENIDEIKAYIGTMKSEDLKNELNTRINKIGHLLKGAPAFDILLEDVNGKAAHLSDFKGKYIYVDLWATWCGPCVAEAPHFEKLQKELNSDEIAFIAISVDASKSAWSKFLQVHKKESKQFISNDRSIKQNWLLGGIPRFILIDRDFKIIDAFAKRPSEAGAKSILMNLIKK